MLDLPDKVPELRELKRRKEDTLRLARQEVARATATNSPMLHLYKKRASESEAEIRAVDEKLSRLGRG
jgi:hypothetical protein